MAFFDGFKALGEELRAYWTSYGGWRGLFKSPAVWAAAILAAICYPLWESNKWADLSLSIVPNLLGFTLGAMAVILAFPSSKFFKVFSEQGAKDSYYIDLASKFAHFIFVQTLALITALTAKAWLNVMLNYLGTFFLFYAVLCAALTGSALFAVAQLSNEIPDDHKGSE